MTQDEKTASIGLTGIVLMFIGALWAFGLGGIVLLAGACMYKWADEE